MANLLLVDDDPSMLDLLGAHLTRGGHRVLCRGSAAEALEAATSDPLDAVITDLRMSGMDGLELCQRIVGDRPGLPVVVLTAYGNMDAAVAAIRAGASDFVTKPVELDQLLVVVERVLRRRRLDEVVKQLPHAEGGPRGLEGILGASPPMRKVFDLLARVADLDTSVLIEGESGTGKELVARALHDGGRRRAGPFVALNCAALPDALLESELFGHARGAFTDAKTARVGLFAQAHGGTLFLDEIDALPFALQPKLLRALQERAVRPVGGDVETRCDVRFIAASNRPLRDEVSRGAFREDLFYRLDVITVDLPPLRARGGDVLLLGQRFIEEFAAQLGRPVVGLSPAAAGKLLDYDWPGNVRELRNCIERAVALAGGDRLVIADLPERVARCRAAEYARSTAEPIDLASMAEVERRHILRVLEATGGNKTAAAVILGLNRRTLYRKLAEYRLTSE